MSFKQNKVFGVGLVRTGTTSLGYAFRIIGYKTCLESVRFKWDDNLEKTLRNVHSRLSRDMMLSSTARGLSGFAK